MRKLLVLTLAVVLVVGMSTVVMAQNNDADVDQIGNNQGAVINQDGNNNEADVYQFSDNDGPQEADVLQRGRANLVDISQEQIGGGNTGTNFPTAKQRGVSNEIIQNTTAPGMNGGQNVEAIQDGRNNKVEQHILSGYTNSLYSYQFGTNNYAYQSLAANHSHLEIYQNGQFNDAYQFVDGSNHGYMGSEVIIDQDGRRNFAKQDIEGGSLGTQTTAVINQSGRSNSATQLINGSDNKTMVNQDGFNNTAMTNQVGNNNNSDVIQNGSNQTTTIDQVGNDNNTTVIQN